MKLLRLMPIVSFLLIFNSNSGYSQPPVIDESDEYSLASSVQETPYSYSLSKSADEDDDDDEQFFQDESSIQEQPIVKNKAAEGVDPGSDSLAEQVHNLQAEIQELRGQIEVQAHDLKMFQQQQLAFYRDLDNRLQNQKNGKNERITASNTGAQFNKASSEKNNRTNPAEEQISYLAAYELVKTKQFDQALIAMQQFIHQYPDSGYSANAYYWTGELYLFKLENENALQAFNVVTSKFPKSSKAAASGLKACYALANLGQIDAARSKLSLLINEYPGTKTAQLAKQKLDSMN